MSDRRVAPAAGSFAGRFRAGEPHAIVVHSLEAPARAGMAYSLATGWLQHAGVSIHSITDPGESVDMVDLGTVAYHCGGGNPYGVGNEHTGYAAWSFDQWTEPVAFAALRLGAKKVAAQARALGWKAADLRWLSIAQLRAGERGLCTHNDMRLAFGGTTHTDPGPWFPYAIFLQMVQQWFGGAVVPSTTPNPTSPGPGGAEGDDMFTDEDRKKLDGLAWTLDQVKQRTDLGATRDEVVGKLDAATWLISQVKDRVDPGGELEQHMTQLIQAMPAAQIANAVTAEQAGLILDLLAKRLAA